MWIWVLTTIFYVLIWYSRTKIFTAKQPQIYVVIEVSALLDFRRNRQGGCSTLMRQALSSLVSQFDVREVTCHQRIQGIWRKISTCTWPGQGNIDNVADEEKGRNIVTKLGKCSVLNAITKRKLCACQENKVVAIESVHRKRTRPLSFKYNLSRTKDCSPTRTSWPSILSMRLKPACCRYYFFIVIDYVPQDFQLDGSSHVSLKMWQR